MLDAYYSIVNMRDISLLNALHSHAGIDGKREIGAFVKYELGWKP